MTAGHVLGATPGRIRPDRGPSPCLPITEFLLQLVTQRPLHSNRAPRLLAVLNSRAVIALSFGCISLKIRQSAETMGRQTNRKRQTEEPADALAALANTVFALVTAVFFSATLACLAACNLPSILRRHPICPNQD
jgi:hypothetical protein